MSILSFFGLGARPASEKALSESDTVRKISEELQSLPEERARYVACFAFILSRVAYADREISVEETSTMQDAVQRYGELPEAQAVLAVEIAKQQALLFGGTDNFVVTREFKEISSLDQRIALIHCLFAVSAADDSISTVEDNEVHRVAKELGIEHRDVIALRHSFREKLEVLKKRSDDG